VHLENTSIAVRVTATDYRASHLTGRIQQLLTSELLGANRTLRENANSPQVVIKCNLTRFEFSEQWETRGKARYLVVRCVLECAYKAVRTRDNYTYDGDTLRSTYEASFLDGEGVPSRSEIEDSRVRELVHGIVRRLANVEETFDVRIMRKDELKQCSRLAQAGQWLQYIDCINALREKPNDREFEGDRRYDIGIAYEALAYEHMWKDYERAERYFELAERYFREAQEKDPREREYVRALARMLEGKRQFGIIKARFPKATQKLRRTTGASARSHHPPLRSPMRR